MVSEHPQPCTDTCAPLEMLSSMFLSWEQADTNPAGDSPVLSCGHDQLPTHNTELLQPLLKWWFYSPKTLAALCSLAEEDCPLKGRLRTGLNFSCPCGWRQLAPACLPFSAAGTRSPPATHTAPGKMGSSGVE